ncbi:hypothetical protein AWM79_20680 [Pseudomonas agarici]|uniref:DUF2242 domain-containing protein n=1 Tax=Pseudomonas agarici TaxID=46677 RepID=A0A0X1T689_PSEAA|nr:DUF2242 domain-containing protein [Pseudomonas agarici]AMB87578.1 hypothetical protein AWM79_20680 [Pseudomonas agarici]NWB90022.1 DUF2242 domain-containing protein [Pseudomonas agarici]NWC08200.1 DUF2242 domain-containing protein [Pseudomonas agarici]SEK84117.1 hypothetical protein SAMN05216604_107101 [Pseudomonas agarici]
MSISTHSRVVVLALVLAAAAGCSSPKTAVYEHENFDDSGTFSRNYPVTDTASCEAARRALLSQGYIITSSDPKLIAGNKSFQQTGDTHLQISFSVVCAADGGVDHHSTMFANALQDRYALKKVNNSASLGVGVLGSVSMPIGSTDDSMVKVASETVSSAKFYDRFFTLVELFLPPEVKKEKHTDEKPKADLGVPEVAPAAIKPEASVPPPAESAKAAEPSHVEPTPVAPALSAPAIAEPVKLLPQAPATTPDESATVEKPAEPTPASTEPATPAQ